MDTTALWKPENIDRKFYSKGSAQNVMVMFEMAGSRKLTKY
jgi:hypothetical protein